MGWGWDWKRVGSRKWCGVWGVGRGWGEAGVRVRGGAWGDLASARSTQRTNLLTP